MVLYHVDVLDNKEFKEDVVNKQVNIKTEQMTADTYYFKPGQVLKYHKHKGADQIFFVLEGHGKFYLNFEGGEGEKAFDVKPGSIMLAPADTMHQLENTSDKDPLVASQVTKVVK